MSQRLYVRLGMTKPVAGDNFRHPAPYQECRLQTSSGPRLLHNGRDVRSGGLTQCFCSRTSVRFHWSGVCAWAPPFSPPLYATRKGVFLTAEVLVQNGIFEEVENDRNLRECDCLDFDLIRKSMIVELADADVMFYVAFGLPFRLSFIGSGKVRVRLAGFAHLAAGPFGRTGCFLSPERRDG